MAKSAKKENKKQRVLVVTYVPVGHSDEALANLVVALKEGISEVQKGRDKKSTNGGHGSCEG